MSTIENEAAPSEGKQEEATPKTFTQDEVSAIAAKEAKKAREAATSGLLSDLGFNDPDELKGAVTAFKEYQEKQKTTEQRLAELEQERKNLGEKSSRYETTLKELLDGEIAAIPEDRRSLVPDLDDPVAKLTYITKNRTFLTGSNSAPLNVGTGSAPGAPKPTAPFSYEDFKKLKPNDLIDFHKEYPDIAQDYSERLKQGR